MTMRRLSRLGFALAVAVLVAGTAAPARGAVLWTLTASPLTVTTGVQTTFSLRASLTLPGDIRCVEVEVPDNFTVQGAAVVGSNAGDGWFSEVFGNEVWIRTKSGGSRLRLIGDYVDFTITATAWSTGALPWASHSHPDTDCQGAESPVSVPPIVLVVEPAATPTPSPTIVPTLAPTPSPSPSVLPTPLPSASIAVPHLSGATPRPTTAPSSAVPATPLATPSPASSPEESSPAQSSRPSGSVEADVAPPPAPQPPSGGAGEAEGLVIADPASTADGGAADAVPVGLGTLGLLGSIDIWIVPGLLLGVPGLLVVAFVVLQALGALAWIPAIRRLGGREAVATP